MYLRNWWARREGTGPNYNPKQLRKERWGLEWAMKDSNLQP